MVVEGAEVGRFTSTGLGIGTSSPAQKLTVNNTSGATTGGIRVYATDQTYARLAIENLNGQAYHLVAGTAGASNSGFGIYDATAGATRVQLDSSGNLGLGVTPSAWSGMKAFQLGDGTFAMSSDGAGAGDGSLTWNGYYNGTNWIYGYTGGVATRYRQNESGHAWFTAPSGTAGNAITFTQAMTLDASGRLGVGTTSPTYPLTVQANSSTQGFRLIGRASDNIANMSFVANDGSTEYAFINTGATYLALGVNSAERARITSGGDLLVGNTSLLANANYFGYSSGNTWGVFAHANGVSSGTEYIKFYYNNGQIGSITQSGTTAVLYNVTSDQRLKENIVDAPEFGSVIDSIKVRSYDWKTDQTHQRAGFVAQELVNVAPEAVHQPTNPEDMMAVDYSKLVPMLVKEIQSLRQRVAQLESN